MTRKAGDFVKVEVAADPEGGTIDLRLEDRVLIDPSAGQWESGWFAFRPGDEEKEDAPWFFVSDDGAVYDEESEADDERHRVTRRFGVVILSPEEKAQQHRWSEFEQDFGGAFDGHTVTSDADPGL